MQRQLQILRLVWRAILPIARQTSLRMTSILILLVSTSAFYVTERGLTVMTVVGTTVVGVGAGKVVG